MAGVETSVPRPWRAWIVAARVPTLTAAAVPVIVGTAVALRGGYVRPLAAAAALVVAAGIQIGTNFSNDAFDFLRGADTLHRRGPVRVTQSGLLPARRVLAAAYACFGTAALAGAYCVMLYGWPVLAAGLLAIAAGLAYTGGPWPIGYHGLGELFVFLFFGVMAVTGTAYVQMGTVSGVATAVSVPVGLLVTAILIVNNLRDIETDRTAGKRTLAVMIGDGATRVLYLCCLAGAFVSPVVLHAAGLVGGWWWLPWLTLPMMVSLGRTILRSTSAPALNRALARTARLHLWFGVLLAASLV
jgi:1,4-dihydroxy-2-naphthoate polyprenyltransferase